MVSDGAHGLTDSSDTYTRAEVEGRVVMLLSGTCTPARAAELGLLGLAVPIEYGGSAMSRDLQGMAWGRVFERNHLIGQTLRAHYQVCRCISEWGTLSQRNNYLPNLANGQRIGLVLPDSLHVSKDDDRYILWGDATSTGMYTESGLVLLRGSQHAFGGWLIVLVEMLPHSRKTKRGKMNFHVKNCRVPASCFLHEADPNIWYQGRNGRWRRVLFGY
jgi:alkylation response protein AidB-like acyl-CoA dehydrogenase